MHDFSAVTINANREKLCAVFRCGGEPNVIVPNHRRRPSLAFDGCFPADVLSFGPGGRQVFRGRMAVPCRAAELRPIVSVDSAHEAKQCEEGTLHSPIRLAVLMR